MFYMNYEKHLNLKDKHALLGASRYSWLNKDDEQLVDFFARQYITSIGTGLHDIARKHIKHGFKITKASKKEVLLSLIEDYHIPGTAIDRAIDFDAVFENFAVYTNDAIGYRMIPEQILYYSDNCFGTVDAISPLDSIFKNKLIRIHDLKTGKTPAHMDQLLIYLALFCLEYHIKPFDIEAELKIYQDNEIISYIPAVEDVAPIMDRIISADRLIKMNKED